MEPCDCGIVLALAIEAGGLVDLLEEATVTRGDGLTVRQGRLDGRRVVLVESGVGRENAARATHALVDAHRPLRIVSAGFAGGLDPALRPGDLVVADSLVDLAGALHTFHTLQTLPTLHSSSFRVGRLLTVDRVVREPGEKQELGRKHEALAADMESLAVAEVCRQRDVPFLAVRAISDTADEELPRDVERLLAQTSGPARWGAAVRSIWRRPSSLKDLLRLRQRALETSDRLAKFLAEVIRQAAIGQIGSS
jgi:adenosylhomocysteine nucleosidase